MGAIFILIILIGIILIVMILSQHAQKKEQNAIMLGRLQSEGYNFNRMHNFTNFIIAVDDDKKILMINILGMAQPKFFDYIKLIDFEVIEDGIQMISGKLGASAIGGALFGTVGAIVGSSGSRKTSNICTNLLCRIFVDDISNPQYTFTFINTQMSKSGIEYNSIINKVRELTASLTYILNKNEETNKTTNNIDTNPLDIADQIKKFANLKEQGIITTEEFEEKKKQLIIK